MIRRFAVLASNISIIYKAVKRVQKRLMKEYGLKGNHAMCLFYLMQNKEGLTASQLSDLIGIDKAAVSRLVTTLFKSGYIEYRDFKGGKKYNTIIVLSEQGEAIADKLNEIVCWYMDKFGSGVSEKDRVTLYCSLRTIANNLTDGVKQGII